KGRYGKFIFINQQRRKMSPRAVQYIVKGISAEILGRENAITPHYFRAACAVHLLESGVDIRQVQEIIGWKSLTVVQNYTRVTPQRQIQLKEQHHPSFQSQRLELKKHEEKSSILEQMKALRRELAEERRRHHQEITELKQASQQDQFTRMKELQSYEKRHQEAIETLKQNLEQEQRLRMQERQTYEQRVDDLLKAQQQLVQALTQKSS
ncbi:MAG: tyrosine-type recombinase/integrase, partial [Candidatus Hodarchaeota archaeon]